MKVALQAHLVPLALCERAGEREMTMAYATIMSRGGADAMGITMKDAPRALQIPLSPRERAGV
jgi:hypothetical protein